MNAEKTNTLKIRTPEGIEFSLLLAGPVTRFLAWSIDIACILAATTTVNTVVGALGIVSLDFARALTLLSYFLVTFGYGIATEWYWQGQTLGKRLLRLRVVDVQGFRLQFSQIVVRNLLRLVDSLPLLYALGGTACFLSAKSQRLGDFVANTIVIRTPQLSDPDLNQILSGKYNSLRAHPHLAARLRQRISPQEAEVALQAVVRRNELDPEARVSLFGEISSHFRSLVEFPEEAVEGITDEQYVRNVVDIVFNARAAGTKKNVRS
ncbi:MAG: RDD family protein [Thermodesulfovibrionales bacterium]